jgi:hypothetical protein
MPTIKWNEKTADMNPGLGGNVGRNTSAIPEKINDSMDKQPELIVRPKEPKKLQVEDILKLIAGEEI